MKLTPKKRNVHGQRERFAFGTQRNLYSTDLCWGFALGVTQVLAFIDTKPMQGPNANDFASQWSIGFTYKV